MPEAFQASVSLQPGCGPVSVVWLGSCPRKGTTLPAPSSPEPSSGANDSIAVLTAIGARNANVRRTASWALAVLAITVIVRLPALLHRGPIDDEAMYAVIANEIVDGGRPYVDVVERKPPLLFWTYAAIVRIAGKYNWPALHAASLLWTFATLGGLYLAGRRLFDAETGIAAACVVQRVSTMGHMEEPGTERRTADEPAAGVGVGDRVRPDLSSSRRRFRTEVAVAGALVAMALLLKQPAAIAALPMAMYLALPT